MVLLNFIVGVFLAMIVQDGYGIYEGSAPNKFVRILSTSHTIDFPDEILLSVVAEASTDITDLTLVYRLGSKSVRIYAQSEFVPSNRVSVKFKINTGGINYIPPGVDINYYYVVSDANNDVYESQSFFLEYKDTSYEWQKITQGDLTLLWHDLPQERVSEIATNVSEHIYRVKTLLQIDEVNPMKAVILNSNREAETSFPFVSYTTRSRHVYSGFAFSDLDVFLMVGLNIDTMIHEITHLLLDEAIYRPGVRIPVWFNEGFAMYFESSGNGRANTLAQAIRNNRLLPSYSLARIPGKPEDVKVFYAQAWSFMNYIIGVNGEEHVADLIRVVNEGKNFEEALFAVYGKSTEDLEKEWRDYLFKDSVMASRPDIGTVATSLIISGVAFLTVIIVSFRWIRRIAGLDRMQEIDL